MNVLRSFLLITLFYLSHCSLSAQDFIRLKGVVVDIQSGEPVPFVTVRVKDAPVGTITNLKGEFSFWISRGYVNRQLVFSSVGYKPGEVAIKVLNTEQQAVNRIELKIDSRQLPGVTVVSEERLSALEVLRRAIGRITINCPIEAMLYDAYYRERVLENGVVIKYADAAVTFAQGPYDAAKYDPGSLRGAEWKSSKRFGSWLGAYGGTGHVGDRLHDHFGHKTREADRVRINELRVSLNHTRHRFIGSVEGGPLSTLSRDLVKYLAHFMDRRNFKDYVYELVEVPGEDGKWDYIVKFSPKKKPGETGRRKDLLTGEIYIDQESYAIKKLVYRVGRNYRQHICSLKTMDVKHYGYEVIVDYMSKQGKWRMEHIRREDQFIYQDTTNQTTTPYRAITEIFVTDIHSNQGELSADNNLENREHNSLQNLEMVYDPSFWQQYGQQVPQAVLEDSLRTGMEELMTLEEQFAMRKPRDEQMTEPVAMVKSEAFSVSGLALEDDYQWITSKEQKTPAMLKAYMQAENAYANNYFLPLRKTRDDILTSLTPTQGGEWLADTLGNIDTWAALKKTGLGNRYQVWKERAKTSSGTVPVTILFTGKDKDRWLKKRPVLIQIGSKNKTGEQMKFDPFLMPILSRGIIVIYVHLKDVETSVADIPDARSLKQQSARVDELTDVIKYLIENGRCDKTKVFARGRGAGASLIMQAIIQEPDLIQGAFLDRVIFDQVAAFPTENIPGNTTRASSLVQLLKEASPYWQLKTQSYPVMAFFSRTEPVEYRQAAKVVAKLRALKTNNNPLLLKAWPVEKTGKAKSAMELSSAYQYALLFQWLDDLGGMP